MKVCPFLDFGVKIVVPTVKLYENDSYIKTFDAMVLSCEEKEDKRLFIHIDFTGCNDSCNYYNVDSITIFLFMEELQEYFKSVSNLSCTFHRDDIYH